MVLLVKNGMTMAASVKRSISLSQTASDTLEDLVRIAGQDRSAVIEAAIRQLASLSESAVLQAVRETLDTKRAGTPSGWRSLFWGELVEQFHLPPNVYAFASNQPYGPRTFDGCQVVFLLPNTDGIEDGTLSVHVFESAQPDMQSSLAMTWQYSLRQSPFEAARKTAEWIQRRKGSTSPKSESAT